MSATITAPKKCHHCGGDNPDQSFCGSCGSPLLLSDYIAQQVKDRLSTSIQNRDVLEMDSSIKVFKQAWDWIKLIFGVAVGLLVLTGAGVLWKASDFWSGVEGAKDSVVVTAKNSGNEITQSTAKFQQEMTAQLNAGKASINKASKEATLQSETLRASTVQTKSEMLKQTASLRADIESSRQQLQAAGKLEPEIQSLRLQMTEANREIQSQQKTLASSQDFVKSVFASHTVEYFYLKFKEGIVKTANSALRFALYPPKGTYKNTVVVMLTAESPVAGTIQLQQQVAVQPPRSFFAIHNLILFFWGDPPNGLERQPLSVSYFPDKGDKEIFHSLSEHDGRIFADDLPLPNFSEPDADFKNNKWMVKTEDGSILLPSLGVLLTQPK